MPIKSVIRITLLTAIMLFAFVFLIVIPPRRMPQKSRDAKVAAEIAQLQQSLNNFKAQHGLDAPSSITINEDPSKLTPVDRATIRRLWPMFDFQHTLDLNDDGDTDDVHHLNGAECLVFFLGGIQTKHEAFIGFSKNPMQPFDTQSINRTYSFEFDTDRLTDVDKDGFAEYGDPLTQTPYLYINSQPGSRVDINVYPAGDHRNLKQSFTVNGQRLPVQIISAGEDGVYGEGGDYSDDTDLNGNRRAERDNVTSFIRPRSD